MMSLVKEHPVLDLIPIIIEMMFAGGMEMTYHSGIECVDVMTFTCLIMY